MTNPAPRAEVTRVFDAPRALVWRAWTDPASLSQWWGPAGYTTPWFEADPCVGGVLSMVMRGPDGGERVGLGRFVEVEEPARLVFELGPLDEAGNRLFTALHTVVLEDLGNQTRVSITVTVPDQGAFTTEHFQGMASAWREFFNRLETLVAAGEAPCKMVLRRAFNAPRELVWRAWTDPAQLSLWWGPRGFTNPRCEVDLCPGGAMHIDMTAPDGTVHPMWGEVVEVVEPERLVFRAGSLDVAGNRMFLVRNTVSFDKMGDQTLVTVLYQVLDRGILPPEVFGGAEEGMCLSLDKLSRLVEPSTADREILVARALKAPREKVWRAWTDPALAARWWGPNGFTTTTRKMEVRVGGVWVYTMHGPDGTDFPNCTTYLEVRPHHRLVYDQGTEEGATPLFRATVLFLDMGEQTHVTLQSVFSSKEIRDEVVQKHGAVEGGNQHLANLAAFVEEA